jgi:hypothetical protein
MAVRELGRFSSTNPEHPLKEWSQIAVSESGRFSFANPEQPLKEK